MGQVFRNEDFDTEAALTFAGYEIRSVWAKGEYIGRGWSGQYHLGLKRSAGG